MMQKLTYLIINLLVISGPLILSFDKKVAFYKNWKYAFTGMIITSALYLLWDVFFTLIGVWKFNMDYVTGFHILNLPWEEFFFFIAVPYGCLFIYECLKVYLPGLEKPLAGKIMTWVLLVLSLVVVIYNYNKLYTAVTGILLFFTLLNQWLVTKGKYMTHLYVAWIISLIPMAIVNGLLTSLPVLIYNNSENLGIRIHTLPINNLQYGIPVEDFFYNLLYMLWMIWIYEARKNRKSINFITPVDDEENDQRAESVKH